MTIPGVCERCGVTLAPGDRVQEVRTITRVLPDGTVTHDRGDALTHVTCPT